MKAHQFVVYNNLAPLDAIVLKKKFFGMVDHYALYMGVHDGKHTFVANYTEGVKVIGQNKLQEFLNMLVPQTIIPFRGNHYEFDAAWNRAVSRIGEEAYSYFHNNCEHFVSWVHNGEHTSTQVENFKDGVKTIAVGAAVAVGIYALVKLFGE